MNSTRPKYIDVAEAYGIAVRAGLITPCLQDENEFRKMLGLSEAPETVIAHWRKIGGVKQPITLQSGTTQVAEGDALKAEGVVADE